MLILFVVLNILFNVAGQLFMKKAAMTGGVADGGGQRAIFSPWFLGGVVALGLSMLAYIQVLRRLPLTIAHPINGVLFALVPVSSHLLWNEPLPASRFLGILVIIAGIVLVARAA
jgi:undecaprenyl phosphate-alpha-L-ara4N flippase subunit ArnE